jgi:hypothetical protein
MTCANFRDRLPLWVTSVALHKTRPPVNFRYAPVRDRGLVAVQYVAKGRRLVGSAMKPAFTSLRLSVTRGGKPTN